MKAVFMYQEDKYIIEVPIWLAHINKLTCELAQVLSQAEDEEIDIEEDENTFSDAYDYLVERCCFLFGEETGLPYYELYADFSNPTNEEEKEFGCIVNIYRD